ncbi:membrane protein [Lentimicrobium sp.]
MLLTLLIQNVAYSQGRISSPYSRFGIGDIMTSAGANQRAMGGIGYSLSSPFFVNVMNPATYISFDTLSFIFDVGADARSARLTTLDRSESANAASLSYLKFGFPVTRWWRGAFGLVPYSSTNYHMQDLSVEQNIGSVKRIYQGEGGINQLFVGSAFKLHPNLSIGFNMGVLFGTISQTSANTFPDSAYRMNYKIISSTKVKDIYLNYGIHYRKTLKNNMNLATGLSFSNNQDVSARMEQLGYRYFVSSTGVDNVVDTLVDVTGLKGSITLPANLGFGVSLGKPDKWLVGADVQYQMWDNYKNFDRLDSLQNNFRLALGGEFTPSVSTVTNYFQRITYRAGLNYQNSFLQLRGQRIDEFGISFGFAFPLPRTRSTINLSTELGTRGTTAKNLVKENYFRITLGLSIFERWFIIRKYD